MKNKKELPECPVWYHLFENTKDPQRIIEQLRYVSNDF